MESRKIQVFSFMVSFGLIASLFAETLPETTISSKNEHIISDSTQSHAQMQVISAGDESLSLDQQLRGVKAPQVIMPENPVAIADKAQINYPVMVGNESQIEAIQSELYNMFLKVDQNAHNLSKPEQYIFYLLYKQAQQNQLILEQNNKMILSLEKISLQNEVLLNKEK